MTKSVRCPIATMGWGASIAMAIMATHGDYYVTNPAKVGVAHFGLKFHPHVTLEFRNGGWNSGQPSVSKLQVSWRNAVWRCRRFFTSG